MFRRARGERLETRELLAGDWQNPFRELDVTGDGLVVPLDALVQINELNARTLIDEGNRLPPRIDSDAPYYDTDGDGLLLPVDVLRVINALNTDNAPPTVVAGLYFDSAPQGDSNDDRLTSLDWIVAQFDDLTGVQMLEASLDDGPFQALQIDPRTGNYLFMPDLASNGSQDGSHSVRFIATDPRGNTSAPQRIDFSYDTQAPGLTRRFGLAADTDSGYRDDDGITNQNMPILSATVDGVALVSLFQGEELLLQQEVDGQFQYGLGTLVDGGYEYRLVLEDAAGNRSDTISTTVVVDTAVPSLDIEWPTTGDTVTTLSRLQGQFASSGSGTGVLRYQFDDSEWRPLTTDRDGRFDRQFNLSDVPDGIYQLTLAASDLAGNETQAQVDVTVARDDYPFSIQEIDPLDGTANIGVTFRPQLTFSKPVDATSLNGDSVYASFSGSKLPANVVTSLDGLRGWLFFTQPLPDGSQIEILVEGDRIISADGQLLDADGDGVAGGTARVSFSTVSLLPLPGTSLVGRIVDPGPDNRAHTGDDRPLADVEVYLLGRDHTRARSGADGRFELSPVPGGNVKIVVDGRTAGAPVDNDSIYFPEMVMDANMLAGTENFVMAGMPDVHLPRLESTILTSVDNRQAHVITVPPEGAPNLTDEQRRMLTMELPAGSLLDANGQPVATAQVGISTVPPEYVQTMLPPGVMQDSFNITIQTPGVTNFATPAALTFPNELDAAPGTQLNLLSFDHTTGRLVIEGTATVSADGKMISTDPGTGITHPGWHPVIPPGTEIVDCAPPIIQPRVNIEPSPTVRTRKTGEEFYQAGLRGHLFQTENTFPEKYHETVTLLARNAASRLHRDKPPCDPANRIATPLLLELTFGVFSDEFLDGARSRSVLLYPEQELTLDLKAKPVKDWGKLQESTIVGSFLDVKGKTVLSPVRTVLEEQAAYYQVQWNQNYPKGNTTTIRFAKTLIGETRTHRINVRGDQEVLPRLTLGNAQQRGDYRLNAVDSGRVDLVYKAKNSLEDDLTVRGGFNSRVDIYSIPIQSTPASSSFYFIDLDAFDQALLQLSRANIPFDVSMTWNDVLERQEDRDAVVRDALDGVKNLFTSFYRPGDDPNGLLDDLGLVRLGFQGSNVILVNQFLSQSRSGLGFSDVVDTGSHETQPLRISSAKSGILNVVAASNTSSFSDKVVEMARVLNAKKPGQIGVFLDRLLPAVSTLNQKKPLPDPGKQLSSVIAKVMAHELGHQLGLVHLRNNSGPVSEERKPHVTLDIMDEGYVDREFKLRWDGGSLAALPVALGFDYSNSVAFRSLQHYTAYYKAVLTSAAKGISPPFLDGGEQGFDLRVAPIGAGWLERADTGWLADSIDAGTVAVDGPGGDQFSYDLHLKNYGDRDLTIERLAFVGQGSPDIRLADPVPAATVLDPQEELTLTIVFDPQTGGQHQAELLIEADGLAGQQTVAVFGTGQSSGAELRFDIDNNNLGGTTLGVPTSRTATLTNLGAQDLQIDQIGFSPDARSPQFQITGLPDDFPAESLVIPPGGSQEITLQFRPDLTGLQPATLAIESNDANKPMATFAVVGTGLNQDLLAELDWGNDYVALETPGLTGAPVLRQATDASGHWSIVVPPEESLHFAIFDPVSGLIAHGDQVSGESGAQTDSLPPMFGASSAPDQDGDGLPDDVEFAIGSDPRNRDTNGDGLSDFAALTRGLSPLSGTLATVGILSGVQLPGQAEAVVAAAYPGDPVEQVALVANGEAGLSVVDITDPTSPIVLSQLPLPGDSRDIAYDPIRQMAIVAAAEEGLHAVDMSNPRDPVVLRTMSFAAPVVAAEVLGDDALVATGTSMARVNLDLLETIDLLGMSDRITDLMGSGTTLYATTADRRLHAIRHHADRLEQLDSLSLDAAGGRIDLSGSTLIVPALDRVAGGMSTVDVTDPTQLVLLSGPDNPRLQGLPAAAAAHNGGDAVLLVGQAIPGTAGNAVLDILDIRDPAQTDQLVATIDLAGDPRAVSIAGGLALVPSGPAGLFVVNFQNADFLGAAPTAALQVLTADAQASVDGHQVLEAATIRVVAAAEDDVQVSAVDLLVNGIRAARDVAAPFDLSFRGPAFDAAGDNLLSLQARVTDTGGNVSLSAPVELRVIEDLSGPRLIATSPATDAAVIPGQLQVDLVFDEALDSTTVNGDSIQLRDSTDQTVEPSQRGTLSAGRRVHMTFEDLAEGTYRIVVDQSVVSDSLGNAMGEGPREIPFRVVDGTIFWVNGSGGAWSDPGNWDLGRLPNPQDDVVISVPGQVTITNTHGAAARSIVSDEKIVIDGTLNIGARAEFLGGVLLEQFGFISGATQVVLGGNSRLEGGSILAELTNRGTTVLDSGTASVSLSQFTNEGTVIHETGLLNNSGSGDAMVNRPEAVWDMRSGEYRRSGFGARFVNQGTLRFSGAGVAAMRGDFVHDRALIEVLSGDLEMQADGNSTNRSSTYRVAAGATLRLTGNLHEVVAGASDGEATVFEGGGWARLVDTVVDVGDSALLRFDMAGDGIQLSSTLLRGMGSIDSSGSFDWSRGTIETTSFLNRGTLHINTSATHSGGIRQLVNRGLVLQRGPLIDRGSGTIIINEETGTYELTAATEIKGFRTSTFRNLGTLRHAAEGTSVIEWGVDNEGGVVQLDRGTLSSGDAEFRQTSGSIQLAGGLLAAELRGVQLLGGVLAGSGTILGNLTSNAEIQVGGAGRAGVLEVLGNYVQTASAVLVMEIGGPDHPDYDRLLLNTAEGGTLTTLDGTLRLSLLEDYLPAGGESFELLSFDDLLGQFELITGRDLPNNIRLNETYSSDRLTMDARSQ